MPLVRASCECCATLGRPLGLGPAGRQPAAPDVPLWRFRAILPVSCVQSAAARYPQPPALHRKPPWGGTAADSAVKTRPSPRTGGQERSLAY